MDFFIAPSQEDQKRERQKARELRQSQWWQRKLAEKICYYCGECFDLNDLTMDHKVPIARGGRSIKSNLVVCCKTCNSEKKHSTASEYLASLENH